VLDFHPNHAPWVREAFARAARGESIHAVYRWVRDLPTEARGGRTMRFEAVRKMLASPIYIARPNHGDPDILARPLTRWPALVDDEQWALIRQRVTDHRRMPRQATQQYPVTGILRCPACGERMHGHARPDGRSYRCSGSRLGAGRGRGKCYAEIRGELLEAAVLDEVARVVDTAVTSLPDMQTALARAWEALRHPENDRGGFEARRQKQLQRQAEQARVRLTKAAVLFADGDIDKMGYELLREKAREDLEAAETELERHDPAEPSVALPPLDEVLRQAGGWAEALRGGEVAAQREVLAILVERVVPRRVGYGVYEADINWTPLGHGLRTVSSLPATLAGRRAA
jgi:hypothetical protein